jgi:uncharacterized protein with ATP-grasp and redox domains
MKVRVDCIPCVFRQALAALRLTTDDPVLQETVLKKVAAHYAEKELKSTPAHFSQTVYEIIAEQTGIADPFAEEKKHFNELTLAMLPDCYAALEQTKDPLETGAHLAVAGNIIDLGIGEGLDIHGTLASALDIPFTVNDLELLRRDLENGRELLYIGDNAGEIVFDRVFIEIIRKLYPAVHVAYSVKSGPIINDATMDDALVAGMHSICDVIETGAACIGAPLDVVDKTFIDAMDKADVIISKGQGNFETLNEEYQRNIYFILKAKCTLVAAELGVSLGDSVLEHIRKR